MVELMAAFGIPEADMALMVIKDDGKPVSPNTLRKYFATELKTGLLKANTKIARRLFEKADGGDTTAMIFWLKTRARWREKHDPTEDEGTPDSVKVSINVIDARRREDGA
jgi:hypothetical protein